ncbi:MAG TPA: hypothetical protein VLZ83_11660 [Edaphocola sp.]|nr:hypothetical protein [Edaphocola sp.]
MTKLTNIEEAIKLNEIIKETLSNNPNFDRFNLNDEIIAKIDYYNDFHFFTDIHRPIGGDEFLTNNRNTQLFISNGGFENIFKSEQAVVKKDKLEIHNTLLSITKSYIFIISFVVSILINVFYLFGIINWNTKDLNNKSKIEVVKNGNYVQSEKQKVEIEGDLYFKLINLGSFYNVPMEKKNEFLQQIDSLRKNESISKQDSELVEVVDLLIEHNLIDKPFFYIKLDSTKIMTAYINPSDYEKITIFNREELIDKGKKIKLNLLGKMISDDLFYVSNILKVTELDGKTYWKK